MAAGHVAQPLLAQLLKVQGWGLRAAATDAPLG